MRKGFTLIELLAVIVVLAIIALISVPIITGVIDKAKAGSVKNSAYGIIDAAEKYYAVNMNEGIETSEFICSNNNCISEEKEIKYKGSIDSGKVKIYSDGKVSICIEKDNYGASKKAEEKEVTSGKGSCNDDYAVDENISKKEYDKLKKELEDLKDELNEINNYGTATSSDITTGKTAIVKGEKVTGTYKGIKKILLGTGTSYNLKTNYATYGLSENDYKNLTNDNFLVELQNTTKTYDSWSGGSIVRTITSFKYEYNKTYNSATGTFTMNSSMYNYYHMAVDMDNHWRDVTDNIVHNFKVYLIY